MNQVYLTGVTEVREATLREVGKWLEERIMRGGPERADVPVALDVTILDILSLRDAGRLPIKRGEMPEVQQKGADGRD